MPQSSRYFTRELTSRVSYRNSRGQFISREEGLRQGVTPEITRFYTYRRADGRRVSRAFAERQRQRIITISNEQELRRTSQRSATRQAQTSLENEGVTFLPVFGQQVRRLLLEATTNNDNIGVILRGSFYELDSTQFADLQNMWLEISNEYVRLFDNLIGLSGFMVDVVDEGSSLVLDLDSLTPTLPESEELDGFEEASSDFRMFILQSFNRFLR